MSRTQLVEKYAASTSGKMLDLLRSPGSTLGPNLRDLSGEHAVGWDAWNRTVEPPALIDGCAVAG